MKLPSAFEFLPRREGQKLVRALTELGKDRGLHVRAGIQACGEFFIQSAQVRESLLALSGATACNWETAGVFVGALRSRVPPLSLRDRLRPRGRGFPARFPPQRPHVLAGPVSFHQGWAGIGLVRGVLRALEGRAASARWRRCRRGSCRSQGRRAAAQDERSRAAWARGRRRA